MKRVNRGSAVLLCGVTLLARVGGVTGARFGGVADPAPHAETCLCTDDVTVAH